MYCIFLETLENTFDVYHRSAKNNMLASVGRGRCTLLEIKQVYKALSVKKKKK